MKELKEILSNKSTIKLIVIILLVLIYLGFFFRPKVKELFALSAQASELKAEINTTRRDWSDIETLRKRLSFLQDKNVFYQTRLPDEKEIPVILAYLSTAAKKINVKINKIEPGEQNLLAGQIYYGLPILLKAECRFHQLGRFIDELEKADRFMKITDLKIVANQGAEQVLYIQLVIVTYVMS
ncbi:type 4a pilus biogenesis protein PilO [Candidatus Omnitrophota bacterium]